MTIPRPEGSAQSEPLASDLDASATHRGSALRIEGNAADATETEFSLLVAGEVRPSHALSSVPPRATVAAPEPGVTLLAGSVDDAALGFVLAGDLLGASLDGATPAAALDGDPVDLDRWPAVEAALGRSARQDPVTEPFENTGELSKPLGDPLDPREYVVTVDAPAADGDASYAFDVEGTVVDHPDDATVTADGSRVEGDLSPSGAARIDVRGSIRWIETDGGVDVSVRPST